MTRIYVVEDDDSIRELVGYALQTSGFSVSCFESGEAFWRDIETELPGLIILDIMLPAEDGLSILKNLKKNARTKSLPVIMLTAKTTEYDKIKGLDIGADDYITKPFSVLELISRINAVLRRCSPTDEQIIEAGGIRIDTGRRVVVADGHAVNLTFKEFELLYCLAVNKGIAFSRDKLMELVWGFDYEGESRTVDMHIKTLRKKLGGAGECIRTIRGVGYKLGE